jgi:hypothetical protein
LSRSERSSELRRTLILAILATPSKLLIAVGTARNPCTAIRNEGTFAAADGLSLVEQETPIAGL